MKERRRLQHTVGVEVIAQSQHCLSIELVTDDTHALRGGNLACIENNIGRIAIVQPAQAIRVTGESCSGTYQAWCKASRGFLPSRQGQGGRRRQAPRKGRWSEESTTFLSANNVPPRQTVKPLCVCKYFFYSLLNVSVIRMHHKSSET